MGKKWTHGIERLPQGKDVDSVAICAQRLCRLFTTTSNPDHPPQNLGSSPEIIDSLTVHAVHSGKGRGKLIGVQVFLAVRCRAGDISIFLGRLDAL